MGRNRRNRNNSSTSSSLRDNGCSLCSDGSNPNNLSYHVNDGQTCADVHLQLSMLRYDNAMCSLGQQKYAELCCAGSSGFFYSRWGFVMGAAVVGFFLTRGFYRRRRRLRNESYVDEELPGAVSFSSKSSRVSTQAVSDEVEMASSYVNMKHARHKSRSKNRPIFEQSHGDFIKTRSSSRSRGGGNESRCRDRPSSRSRQKESRSGRDSRTRSQSRGRQKESRSGRDSRARSQSRSRQKESRSGRDSRAQSQSRSRPRDMREQTRSSRNMSRSRSRARSRSRPREKVNEYSRNRSRTGGSRSRSRTRGSRSLSRARRELDRCRGTQVV